MSIEDNCSPEAIKSMKTLIVNESNLDACHDLMGSLITCNLAN